MTGTIIEAGIPHAGVISALHRACFDELWNEKAVADILAMPGARGLIIGPDTPKGFILFRLAADEAEIISIAITPDTRRKGLAGLLLQASTEHARQRGATRMFLEVAQDNAAARAFYEKAGFTIVGRRAGYYVRATGKADAIIYRREITAK